MNNIAGMQIYHSRGPYYDNNGEIIPEMDQEAELQRHHGIGMWRIMRRGGRGTGAGGEKRAVGRGRV